MNIWESREKEERAISLVKEFIELLGEDSNREGLKDTPKRCVNMIKEVLEGVRYTNAEIAQMFDKCFEEDIKTENNNMVIIKDIPIFSFCEHHLALMYNMNVTVAYVPNGKVIGLSKIVRIVDMVGRRLQLQEKIGSDIAEIMCMITDSEDVAVVIEGEHACMTTRGIKKNGSKTITKFFTGSFNLHNGLKKDCYNSTIAI